MEAIHKSGIGIEMIRLTKAQAEYLQPVESPKYHLGLTGYDRAEQDEGKHLVVAASFDLMHGVESPIMVLTCSFVVRYNRKSDTSMPWSEFTDALALAHIVPYLREFVSSTTGRMPSPVLMLDPVNTAALLGDLKLRMEAAKAAKPAAATDCPTQPAAP